MNEPLASLRKDYLLKELREEDTPEDPFPLFSIWFDEALASGVLEPNGMALSTVSSEGRPSSRIVLLKGVDHGFLFFTNYESRKGQDLAERPDASLLFWWREMERQVRIEGRVEKITPEESDTYFHTRPRLSRLGAWASRQSRVLPHRTSLEDAFTHYKEEFAEVDLFPRPPSWGGYRLIPQAFEFWQGRSNRLHDRLAFARLPSGAWEKSRLSP